jgi:hypothetical protein
MPERTPSGPEWVYAAQRLRLIRSACSVFLDRWAVNRLINGAYALDRVAADMEAAVEKFIADPQNRDWSVLYRGSVLDD